VGGAGDAFLAGLAYSWMEDWSIDQTVQFALAAADITLSHAATNNPSLSISTINQLLELQHAG
jgi:pseudouridine kinase